MNDIFQVKNSIHKKNIESEEMSCYVKRILTDNNIEIETKYTPQRYTFDYIEINNCFVNSNGIILHNNEYFYILNQGLNNTPININTKNVKQYDRVVTIASIWCHAIFHYAFDCLPRLSSIPNEILYDKNVYIHTGYKSNYISQWNDILKIDDERIIGGVIFCKTLIVPRPQKAGNSYIDSTKWLSETLFQNHLSKISSEFEYVILTKRTRYRVINESLYKKILNYISQFAEQKKLKLYIHDDQKMPPLKQQQNIFHKAKYVFSFHGAAGIHLYAMQKNTHFVELFDQKYVNRCFEPFAMYMDVRYYSIIHYKNNMNFDLFEKEILNEI